MIRPHGYLPVLPLRNTVLYPGVTQALRVGREKSVKALQKSFEQNNWIVVTAQRDPGARADVPDDLHRIGVVSKVESVRGNPDNGYTLMVRGVERVRLTDIKAEHGYFEAMTENLADLEDADEPTQKALLASLKELSLDVLKFIPAETRELEELVKGIEDLPFLVHTVAANADFDLKEKQKILESLSVRNRVMHLLTLLQSLKDNLQVQADIRAKLNNKFGQSHREQILREQLKAIKEELGEGEETNMNDQYRRKVDEAGMPEEAKQLAESQLKRLQDINPASPEYQVVRNHLDLMLSLPWSKSSEQTEVDLDRAREILDADHYGLDKVKKRILQHLAVLKLKKNQSGSILLLVGPPGVGKTSLAASIARALGRKYARVSLGGVRDDAEIRGHRRTYVGALPGRILSALKKAGENNPVFVLDEIDKMSRGFTGDPAAAMLEVLDPEQNRAFVDHYLDTGFDLSKVFFIGTANSLEGIPGPLLDRMEVIEVSGYTTSEKFHIAKQHLIPKQLEEHGMSKEQLVVPDGTLHRLITGHTREAGVRDLQRKIAELIRASTEKVLHAEGEPVRIEVADLEEALGPERFQSEVADQNTESGVVTGLAWTPVGGDILFVEAALMPGTGQLLMTGQLGDVMKESARIALSLLKSRLPGMDPDLDLAKSDIHVHVPAGAIPKDGPSAGVTMVTALASLLAHRRVDPKLAMTGEVTLRGAIMPVGGIKEKVLAAHRAGITTVLLPRRNEKDLREVPMDIRSQLRFVFVDHVNEVLKFALGVDAAVVPADVVPNETPLIPPPVDA
ncbi:MAG: endopeptidase La [Bdellovibrionaceae bacterium]|nr:endopeptidase La [Pseudobdellovibrionaceae bacterium]MBX3034883.1 endopeptidase La [Pseudobdellovibrionaceae bacterium]